MHIDWGFVRVLIEYILRRVFDMLEMPVKSLSLIRCCQGSGGRQSSKLWAQWSWGLEVSSIFAGLSQVDLSSKLPGERNPGVLNAPLRSSLIVPDATAKSMYVSERQFSVEWKGRLGLLVWFWLSIGFSIGERVILEVLCLDDGDGDLYFYTFRDNCVGISNYM